MTPLEAANRSREQQKIRENENELWKMKRMFDPFYEVLDENNNIQFTSPSFFEISSFVKGATGSVHVIKKQPFITSKQVPMDDY